MFQKSLVYIKVFAKKICYFEFNFIRIVTISNSWPKILIHLVL